MANTGIQGSYKKLAEVKMLQPTRITYIPDPTPPDINHSK